MKVTILGAGRMGSAMALRLIDTGQEVTVWNRERERVVPLADAGATVADGIAAAVDNAAVIITMVTDGPAVRSVGRRDAPGDAQRRCVAAGVHRRRRVGRPAAGVGRRARARDPGRTPSPAAPDRLAMAP
jgi:hypothetical protein